jgi:hypothetical protein
MRVTRCHPAALAQERTVRRRADRYERGPGGGRRRVL